MDVGMFLAEFGHIANAPGGVKQLREMVLLLAVQGKLVEQDPNDEPVWKSDSKKDSPVVELLNEIVTIQKKSFSNKEKREISTLREPFLVGGNKICLPLGYLVKIISGQHLKPTEYNKNNIGIPYITGPAEFGPRNPEPNKWTKEKRAVATTNDILITVKGSGIGKTNICNLPELAISRQLMAIRAIGQLNQQYLYICIDAAQSHFQKQKMGIAIPGIGRKEICSLEVILPCFEEQKRIVAKVDELMALCDRLEAQQQKRSELTKLFRIAALNALANAQRPQELKLSWNRVQDNLGMLFEGPEDVEKFRHAIMNAAIRGNLTQRTTSNASELLEKCSKYKNDLIKEKILKRQKPKKELKDYPFDLPRNWAWSRFSDLGVFGRGKSKHRPRNDPQLFFNGKYPFVQTGDVAISVGKGIFSYKKKYNDFGLKQSQLWPQRTLCITIAANIADSAILKIEACFPDSVVGFIPFEVVGNVEFFDLFVRTAKSNLLEYAPSTAQKNINLGILEQVAIPLPPKNEMKQIVAKVTSLMALCDTLEAQLTKARSIAEKLAQSAIAAITGTQLEDKEKMKAPKTELVTKLRLVKSPSIKSQAPLCAILAKHSSELSAKVLWNHSGLEIDAFYRQLRAEMANGWIEEPQKAEMRIVEEKESA